MPTSPGTRPPAPYSGPTREQIEAHSGQDAFAPQWIRPESLMARFPEQFPPTLAASPWAGMVNRQVVPPVAAVDAANTIDRAHPYQLPSDWAQNYRTATVSPTRGPLSNYPNAISFDALGEPYYGTGITAWLKRTIDNLNAPVTPSQDWRAVAYSEFHASTAQQAVAEVLARENAETQAERPPNVFERLARVPKEAVATALGFLIQPAIAVERYWAGLSQGLAEAAGEEAFGEQERTQRIAEAIEPGKPLPGYSPFHGGSEMSRSVAAAVHSREDALGWFTRLVSQGSPYAMMYNAFRIITSGRDWSEVRQIVGDSIEAGRIAYTGWFEPATRAEFVRRAKAGEDPGLLAIELANPGAELAGQLVFDPLNFVGIGGRGQRDARRISSVTAEFITPRSDDVARLLGTATDVNSEAAAIGRIEAIRDAHSVSARALEARQAAAAGSRRLWALTAQGHRSAVERRIGHIFSWISSQLGNNPEDVGAVLTAMARGASTNPDEALMGIGEMLRFPRGSGQLAGPLFSEAGTELGVMLNRAMTDTSGFNPAGFIDELLETTTVEDLMQMADRRLRPVIDSTFPTIAERIAAGEEISPLLAGLARFDGVAQGKVYTPINRFFANIYMGMSPGYAFRNAVTNTLHVFVDYGFEPGVKTMAAQAEEIARSVLGKYADNIFGPGTFVRRAQENVTRWLGYAPEGMSRGMGPAWAAGIRSRSGLFSTFLRASEAAETGAASVVVEHTVEQVMRRALRPGRALPSVTPLIESGMSREAAEYLVRLVVDNYGDVPAAGQAFRRAAQAGQVETWRTLGWLPEQSIAELRRLGILEPVQEAARNAPDATAFRAGLDDIFRQATDEGGHVFEEVVGIPAESRFAVDTPVIDDAIRSGSLAEDAGAVIQNRSNAMDQFRNEFEFGLHDAEQAAWAAVHDKGLAPQASDVLQRYRGLRERYWDTAHTQFTEARNVATRWGLRRDGQRLLLGMPDDSDWARTWQTVQGQYRAAGVDVGRYVDLTAVPQSRQDVFDLVWDTYFGHRAEFWTGVREQAAELVMAETRELSVLAGIDLSQHFERFNAALREARLADNAARVGGRMQSFGVISGHIPDGEAGVRLIAQRFGIPSVDNAGRVISGSDSHILNAINRYLPEGTEPFARLRDVPQDVAQRAFRARRTAEAGAAIGVGEEAAEAVARAPVDIAPTFVDGVPSFSRAIHESLPGMRGMLDDIAAGMETRWGQTEYVLLDDALEGALATWERTAEPTVAEARLLAGQVGNEARNFTLLNYQDRRFIDLPLAYIYPYQFWYSRTYAHWLQRLGQTPEILAGYAKYRRALEQLHAGAPDWWKYTINTNELFGLDSENPLFFNLEATLNPLNGLTGVDFNDPYRRVSWWTAMLDDLGKFGPSTWTPFSILTAFALYATGEKEAASRWGGRLIPQTATLSSLTALAGVPGGVELDPSVLFFSEGMDPYRERRVGRALGALIEEGQVNAVDALDAGRLHAGPEWEAARTREALERAPGQLASFFLGVGFRSRSISDLTIDRFYDEYFRLLTTEPNLSPEEYRNQMDSLRMRYPFMDALLLSRPTDSVERDASYAYNVLGRIPPGQSSDFAEWAGIPSELVSAFYDSKGHLELWSESERQRFMAGIIDLGAVLDLPDNATRQGWREARNAYSRMMGVGEQLFGEDIWERVDVYYGMRSDDPNDRDLANEFLENNPDIERALDFKQAAVMQSPLLVQYYPGLTQVESYYRGQMYSQIEAELGNEIWDLWDEYHTLRRMGGDYRGYFREHPELERYGEIRDYWAPIIAARVVQFSERIPEAPIGEFPEAQVRPGAGETLGQQQILEQMGQFYGPQLPQLSLAEWQTYLGDPLFNLVEDANSGEALPYVAQRALEATAEEMGLDDYNMILQLVRYASP